MIDTIFTAALAFCVLVGGALAIGSAAVTDQQACASVPVAAQLQTQTQTAGTDSQVCAVAAGARAVCL